MAPARIPRCRRRLAPAPRAEKAPGQGHYRFRAPAGRKTHRKAPRRAPTPPSPIKALQAYYRIHPELAARRNRQAPRTRTSPAALIGVSNLCLVWAAAWDAGLDLLWAVLAYFFFWAPLLSLARPALALLNLCLRLLWWTDNMVCLLYAVVMVLVMASECLLDLGDVILAFIKEGTFILHLFVELLSPLFLGPYSVLIHAKAPDNWTCLARVISACGVACPPLLNDITAAGELPGFDSIEDQVVYYRASPPHISLSHFSGSSRRTLGELAFSAAPLPAFTDELSTITHADIGGSYSLSQAPETFDGATAVAMPQLPGLNNAVVAPTQLVANVVSNDILLRAEHGTFTREMLHNRRIAYKSVEEHAGAAPAAAVLKGAQNSFAFRTDEQGRTMAAHAVSEGQILTPLVAVGHWHIKRPIMSMPRLRRDDRSWLASLENATALSNVLSGVASPMEFKQALSSVRGTRNFEPTRLESARRSMRLEAMVAAREAQIRDFMIDVEQGSRYVRVFTELFTMFYTAVIAETVNDHMDHEGDHQSLVPNNTGGWMMYGNRAARPMVHGIHAMAMPLHADAAALAHPWNLGCTIGAQADVNIQVNLEDILLRKRNAMKRGECVFIDAEGLDLADMRSRQILKVLCHAFGPSKTFLPRIRLVKRRGGADVTSEFWPAVAQHATRGASEIIVHLGVHEGVAPGGGPVAWRPAENAYNLDYLGGSDVPGTDDVAFTSQEVAAAIKHLIATSGAVVDCLDAYDCVSARMFGSQLQFMDNANNTVLDLMAEDNATHLLPFENALLEGDTFNTYPDVTMSAYLTPFRTAVNIPDRISAALDDTPEAAYWFGYYYATCVANAFTWASFALSMKMTAFNHSAEEEPEQFDPRPYHKVGRLESTYYQAMLNRPSAGVLDAFSIYIRNACALMYGWSPSLFTMWSVRPERSFTVHAPNDPEPIDFGMGFFHHEEAHGGATLPYFEAWLLRMLPDFMVLPMTGLVPKWPKAAKTGQAGSQDVPSFVRMGATLAPFTGKWYQQDGGQLYSLNFYYSHDARNEGHVAAVDWEAAQLRRPAAGVARLPTNHTIERWVVPDHDVRMVNGSIVIADTQVQGDAVYDTQRNFGRMNQYRFNKRNYSPADHATGLKSQTFFEAFLRPGFASTTHLDCTLPNGDARIRNLAYGIGLGYDQVAGDGLDERTQLAWRDMKQGAPNRTMRVEYLGPFPTTRMTLPGYNDLITVVTRSAQDAGQLGFSVYHGVHSETDRIYDVQGESLVSIHGAINMPAAFANHSDIHVPPVPAQYPVGPPKYARKAGHAPRAPAGAWANGPPRGLPQGGFGGHGAAEVPRPTPYKPKVVPPPRAASPRPARQTNIPAPFTYRKATMSGALPKARLPELDRIDPHIGHTPSMTGARFIHDCDHRSCPDRAHVMQVQPDGHATVIDALFDERDIASVQQQLKADYLAYYKANPHTLNPDESAYAPATTKPKEPESETAPAWARLYPDSVAVGKTGGNKHSERELRLANAIGGINLGTNSAGNVTINGANTGIRNDAPAGHALVARIQGDTVPQLQHRDQVAMNEGAIHVPWNELPQDATPNDGAAYQAQGKMGELHAAPLNSAVPSYASVAAGSTPKGGSADRGSAGSFTLTGSTSQERGEGATFGSGGAGF